LLLFKRLWWASAESHPTQQLCAINKSTLRRISRHSHNLLLTLISAQWLFTHLDKRLQTNNYDKYRCYYTRLPFSQKHTTCKCVYLVTLAYPIFTPVTLTLTQWPWYTNSNYVFWTRTCIPKNYGHTDQRFFTFLFSIFQKPSIPSQSD